MSKEYGLIQRSNIDYHVVIDRRWKEWIEYQTQMHYHHGFNGSIQSEQRDD